MTEEKVCFVIAPIGDPDSETRRRSDQVLKHVIRPAVGHYGYKAVRADEIDEPGMITSQVIQHVVNDPLVVADLTERNPNVFYELAVRHALRKPLVQLIEEGEKIPFDVAGTRTVYVNHRDLDSVEAAKNQIMKQVVALEKDASDIETPIPLGLQPARHAVAQGPAWLSRLTGLEEVEDVSTLVADWNTISAHIGRRIADPSTGSVDILAAYGLGYRLVPNDFRERENARLRVCFANMFDDELLQIYRRKYHDRTTDEIRNKLKESIQRLLGPCTLEVTSASQISITAIETPPKAQCAIRLTSQRITFGYYRVDDVACVLPLNMRRDQDPAPLAWIINREGAPRAFQYYLDEYERVLEEGLNVLPSG